MTTAVPSATAPKSGNSNGNHSGIPGITCHTIKGIKESQLKRINKEKIIMRKRRIRVSYTSAQELE